MYSLKRTNLRQAQRNPLMMLLLLALVFTSLSLSSYAASPTPRHTTIGTAVATKSSPLIHLQYASFDPLKGEPNIAANLRAASDTHNYIVQFSGPVQQQWKDAIVSAGGQLNDYIPDFAFIVRLDANSKAAVSSLPFVRWIGAYHPAYKLSTDAAATLLAVGQANVYTVLSFAGSDESAIATLPGSHILAQSTNSFNTLVRLQLDGSALSKLVQLDSVKWVELYHAPHLHNEKMREITGVNQIWSNGNGLYGQGQVVAVADTGLDTGSTDTLSPDFAGRVDATFALGRTGDWSDINGHGTHVAGTVLGNGVRSGADPNSHNYAASFAGMAPEAHLVFQSIGDAQGGLGGLPSDLNDLFNQAYNAGARIHTNSWGSSSNGEYNVDAQQVDQYTWAHKDMTVLFSAGNDGTDANQDGVIDTGSLDTPASAKNDITVGASESNRPPNSGWGGGANSTWGMFDCNGTVKYCAAPISSDYLSDNINGMAAFSSRGPAADGRIEPSITNAGTNIISDRSQAPGASTGWGEYNQYYIYEGGTSMSTPGTAGAAALVRQFLNNHAFANPSSALIKATLMDAATDMAPGQYGNGPTQEMPIRPNNVEGWGRVNLLNALFPTAPIEANYNDTLSLSTGQSSDSNYVVTTAGQPIHITLAWSDYPGNPGAGQQLVNDLDLSVTAPDGITVYWGNAVTNGDRMNNVETVDIPNAPAGTYVIHVVGNNVPQGPQPAALVTWGATGAPPTPTPTPSCPIPFTDINGNVFYTAITTLYCGGIVNGTTQTTFSPAATSTRGQFAKVVVLGFSIPAYTPVTGGQDFTDVPPSYFAYLYIETGFHAGVLGGYDANTCTQIGATFPCYGANRPITRGQITKLVVNAAHYPIYTPVSGQTFTDVSRSNVFFGSIETAHFKGVINGYQDGTFRPNDNVRRDAMSQIVFKGMSSP